MPCIHQESEKMKDEKCQNLWTEKGAADQSSRGMT